MTFYDLENDIFIWLETGHSQIKDHWNACKVDQKMIGIGLEKQE